MPGIPDTIEINIGHQKISMRSCLYTKWPLVTSGFENWISVTKNHLYLLMNVHVSKYGAFT